ncbi:uncharacterized protein LOC111395871 [Olea europaea var. sylvestris]|uniref:Uncharacterized protein n=1 Tax=Olea europaea subsp. europaea TaxID=158383 RepID=A0A8S0PCJ6_OLEEU|nr:uncharacterized protein LOC111395871 [Olea europaea var. sylvestris]CAA2940116.1 Hypothetical predicted protein [Olea europaea subsp. europaea]
METMAVDHMIITDNPRRRISFSDEFVMFEDTPYRSDSAQIDSTSDFDFCITSKETCPADELFSYGIIRPLQLQEKFINSKQLSTSKPPLPSPSPPTNLSLKQEIMDQSDQKHQSKAPFWHLKRSSSLHYDHSSKKTSIWSSLSRSNSTGSVPNSKKLSKNSVAISSPSSAKLCSQKPPLRKNSRGLSPVLNGPPPSIISVSPGNLFGFGTLFRNGKGKNIKK